MSTEHIEAMEAEDSFDEEQNVVVKSKPRPKLMRCHSDGEYYEPRPDNFMRPRSRSLYSSPRPLVYVTRRVPQQGLDILMQYCNISQWDSEDPVPRGELFHCVQGVHAILCMPGDLVDAQVLDAAGPQLRAIGTLSESTRHISVEECQRRNIRVISCPPNDHDLAGRADLTVALILLTLRNVAAGRGSESKSHNTTCDLFSTEMTGVSRRVDVPNAMWNNIVKNKTFGIFGKTDLGFAVASRLRQMGAVHVIIGNFRKGLGEDEMEEGVGEVMGTAGNLNTGDFEVVSRKQFLKRADIVCICDNSYPKECESFFDQEAFKELKPGVILVNSDNSHALNYSALYEALRDREILAAGLNTCNQRQVPYQHLLQGLRNCVFMTQTQEDRSDLRHKITMTVTTNLLSLLKETD